MKKSKKNKHQTLKGEKMNISQNNISRTERAMYNLRNLYEGYGYSQYKMSKFEEYDLYVRNKSFLVSDHIITFTDTDGKLMALKPDVTLSIVKNSRISDGGVRKVYYNENVYRVPKGSLSFKEIMQSGLECIGLIDKYSVFEVLKLAEQSLEAISKDFVLNISHIGIISSLIDEMGLSVTGRARVLECIGEKNLHGIDSACLEEGKNIEIADKLKSLLKIKGGCDELLEILQDSKCYPLAQELAEVVSQLSANKKIKIDFSVIDDTRYYSGIIFKGFVKGIPSSILSGGQYDNLLKNMGKNAGAVGFAVYLDLIDELCDESVEYDIDALVLYDDDSDFASLCKLVDRLTVEGERVMVQKRMPERLKYKRMIKFGQSGAEVDNGNA